MICLNGKTVCGGIASGTAYVFTKTAKRRAAEYKPESKSEELKRIKAAVSAVKTDLDKSIKASESETAKDIFEIHRMMLEDEDFTDYLYNEVRNNGETAENAVAQTKNYFCEMFRNTNDEYMIARTDDICDICGNLISCLSGEECCEKPKEAFVLVADELLPGDLMSFEREKLKGIVIGSGSVYSHVSILIKEMGIPAIICDGISDINTGMTALLNGESGTVCFEPDKKTLNEFLNAEMLLRERKKTSPFKNLPCKLYVNIGNPQEASEELFKKCDGIGLFRTEYLYFGRDDLPTEEEQFTVYKNLLIKAKGKPVTVRTFDVGSDKPAKALKLKKEENPALGFRGVRVYSLYPEVFETQLRALLRAAVYGDLRIMYPMITSVREIERIKQAVLNTARELSVQGIEYKLPKQGIMIETPSAALLSYKLAKEVDFFSVGTNDLCQYTEASDRQNGKLDMFCDKECEAVMILIKTAAENAHKNGIEIGICGELASDPEFTEKWLETGIDSLSVSPSVLND